MNRDSCLSLVNDGLAMKRAILLSVACVALMGFPAHAGRPRITAAGLCGTVTDLAGKPIEHATVTAMFANFSTSQETDKDGHWSFGRGAGPHRMEVEGSGYQTFQFDYVDKDDQKSSGADNPEFLTKPKDGACVTPMYVRLAPWNRKSGMVTLDPLKGVHKEKKSK